MASVHLEFHAEALRALWAAGVGPIWEDLNARCIRVENAAKGLVKVDRSTLRQSITHSITDEGHYLVGKIGSNLPYAIFVHDGTGIYGPTGQPITPKNASVLAWPTRGQTRAPALHRGQMRGASRAQTPNGMAFARSVKGSPGNKFLERALPAMLG